MASKSTTPNDGKKKSFNFKVVLLGDTAVGKSSTVIRFCKDAYSDYQQPTIGANFLSQAIHLDKDTTVLFDIWDTAGQERYRSLAPMYYRGAAAALVLYDITSQDTYQGAKSWIKELQSQASKNIYILLAGNKLDMESKREVPKEEAQAYASDNNCLYFEISAKSGENIRLMFNTLADKLPKAPTKDPAILVEPPKIQTEKQGCCK